MNSLPTFQEICDQLEANQRINPLQQFIFDHEPGDDVAAWRNQLQDAIQFVLDPEHQKPAVYLCGPINGCNDQECNNWRAEVKKHFSNTIDPMRRDYRGREAESVNEIVELDIQDIRNSDIILANCPKPSVGTSMEIFFAHSIGKTVIAVVPDKSKASPWLTYHCSELHESLNDAIAATRRWMTTLSELYKIGWVEQKRLQ